MWLRAKLKREGLLHDVYADVGRPLSHLSETYQLLTRVPLEEQPRAFFATLFHDAPRARNRPRRGLCNQQDKLPGKVKDHQVSAFIVHQSGADSLVPISERSNVAHGVVGIGCIRCTVHVIVPLGNFLDAVRELNAARSGPDCFLHDTRAHKMHS